MNLDSDDSTDETSKLETAISQLASNLNVEISDDLLLIIRNEDLKNKKLKSHLARLSIVEDKMKNHMDSIRSNLEVTQNYLKGNESFEQSFKFKTDFEEFRESTLKAVSYTHLTLPTTPYV